jgi:hypothetical protein
MLDTFLARLILFNLWLAVAAGLFGLVRYRWLAPNLRWLALLAGFDASMELIADLLSNLHRHNLFLTPFILVGEIILLVLLYRQVLQSAVFNRVVPWLVGLISLYALLQTPLKLDVIDIPVSLSIISNLVQVGLAGLYFQKLLNELRVERLRLDPLFWLSVALAVYGLGNISISLFYNYLLNHCTEQLQRIVFWGVRNVFNIQLYLAYILALWMRPVPANASDTELT